MLSLATKIFGTSNERLLKNYLRRIEPINALESKYEGMSNEELGAQTALFRERLAKGETLDDIQPEAFAVVREAAKRMLGERHYDVQLVGGMVLHDGKIAEMKTGEGKTLVGTLAVYLNAIEGKGVHVVTVNDYLARRDSAWMKPIFNLLGLSVGTILHDLKDEDRKAAYGADVTYGTNNEFGFDYLRDNMKFSVETMVQRPFNFAIVDEVDSILIDEARTPLIISGPSEDHSELYALVDKVIPKLIPADFEVDEKMKTVTFTDGGTEHVEDLLSQHGILKEGGLYDAENIAIVHHTNQALRAHKLFSRDTDYIVKDGKVIIIDEFTGRMMEGRRFSDGLHQALEAKEGVKIQNENQTLASITFQNYFRMYPKLAGMTGTAMTEVTEFADIYNLGVIEIPTHRAISRLDHDDKIFKTYAEKEQAAVDVIRKCMERGQPVLVGTTSIEKSENLAALLKKNKIPHQVLNARYHEQEAYIIAQAGRPGAITIATNMAGRGTDIKLGGNVEMRVQQEMDPNLPEDQKAAFIKKIEAEVLQHREDVRQAGGLYIIGTERHESRRIDNQLRGRSGRQGDPGESIFFLSLEDDLMRIFGSEKMEMLLGNKAIGLRDGEALTHPWISKALERAQAKVESMNFDIRKNLLKFDNVMNDQRKVIYEQRKDIMNAPDVADLVKDMRHNVIEDIVGRYIPARSYADQWDTETLKSECARLLNISVPAPEWAHEEGIAEEQIFDRITDVSDAAMFDKIKRTGEEMYRRLEKAILLQKVDQHWKEHLLNLDHLRQGINLRAFGQRDPLNEYRAEAFAMFEMMLNHLRESVTQVLALVEFNPQTSADQLQPQRRAPVQETRQDPALMGARPPGQFNPPPQGNNPGNVEQMPVKNPKFDAQNPATWANVPRNAECPCGSGKKFKHCHGRIVE